MSDHLTITPSILYFGTPVVLIVTLNPDGSANITPMSSAWALGRSVVLGLSSTGQGTINLLRAGECTLNFPAADLWPRVERIAPTTGANPVPTYKAEAGFAHEADKFARGGFTRQASETVAPPRIAECPLQFEARLLAQHESMQDWAGQPSRPLLLEVGVDLIHAHRDIVVPGTNHIDTERWNPLHYVFRHYFGNATNLGRNFRAES
ncbi:flavin reductase family protein [Solirhodobacter olei]|uniref:flavin reductase family protein n=1 Tax=Solirhodobacter olei TaxID=2493082 RepID=UPI000FDA2CF4|nr:flavin reductase family protein [Solirhodobacter olei]